MRQVSPYVLLLGNADHREMHPVCESLAGLTRDGYVVRSPNMTKISGVDTGDPVSANGRLHPQLVIVCQSWPEEFSTRQVQNLFALFPLATIVCCFSSWCDSDGRTRDIWPQAVRVPAYLAGPRIQFELDRFSKPAEARAHLPLTASRDEIFAFVHREPVASSLRDVGNSNRRSVVVITSDLDLGAWLEDALRTAGYRPSEIDAATALAVVWDVSTWDHRAATALKEYRSRLPRVPIIALAGFVRPEQIEEIRRCGANRVIAKLSPITTLLEAIREAA